MGWCEMVTVGGAITVVEEDQSQQWVAHWATAKHLLLSLVVDVLAPNSWTSGIGVPRSHWLKQNLQ